MRVYFAVFSKTGVMYDKNVTDYYILNYFNWLTL